MPTEKEMWRKILPRSISTEVLKQKLVEYLESNRIPLEIKMKKGLGNVHPNYFKRSQKYKASSYGGTPKGDDSDKWIRMFNYHIHYGLGDEGEAPFYIVVHTDSKDTKIIRIKLMENEVR